MKVQFKQHRKYGANPKVAGMEKGLDCKPGLHDVPSALKEDKFFQAHLKSGACSVVSEKDEAPAAEEPASEEQSSRKNRR